MKTPRIEEMVEEFGKKFLLVGYIVTGFQSADSKNWLRKALTKAHQAGIDEAVEKVKKNIGDTIDAIAFKTMNEKRYFEGIENGLLHHSGRCMCKTCIEATRHAEMATIEEVAEALDDIIKALQDNK